MIRSKIVKMVFKRILLNYNRNYSRFNYSTVASKEWQSVVGLEVHAQIQSQSKLFSGARNAFSSPVNTNVSLFDCSIPGTLPVLNKRCVEAGVLTALALNCNVNPVSTFDRKHYFYADMPAGYQITQQRSPLANEGYLEFEVYTPGVHKKAYIITTKIKQLQLEQDSGKSLHESDKSLVDLNRAGAPLMEIVFEPDLSDGEEAAALIKELINILQRIGTCSCKMEEGALRIDANISVNKYGNELGTRTEIKNIGSVRGVAGAIKYEIDRQIKLLESGGRIVNETRAWDATTKTTLAMRDKEVQQDYRYMPEPNLPPLHLAMGPISRGCVDVNQLKQALPELPEQTRTRLKENYGLSSEHAIIIVNDSFLLHLFETAIETSCKDYKLITNLLINDLLTLLHKEKIELADLTISGNLFGDLASLINEGSINRATGKLLLQEKLLGNTKTIKELIDENNWEQINDENKIRIICQDVLNENSKIVEQYKKGKTKTFKALLGIVANKSNQRINMTKVDKVLKELLQR